MNKTVLIFSQSDIRDNFDTNEVELLQAKVECQWIAMAIDGPPGNVMTIVELHWSLCTGFFTGFFVSYRWELPLFVGK